jgi:NadR type nicotinamide-nucleotide adenylyltransferase
MHETIKSNSFVASYPINLLVCGCENKSINRIVLNMNLFRIAIVGPESTGKSTLTSQLANHYKTVWTPEYARRYLDRLDHPYTYDDVLAIAKGQLTLEDEMAGKAKRMLFCDTNLIVIKIWLEHKYRNCPDWINDTIRDRRYDIHFLTNIDVPWIDDPQREHPHLREFLFQRYCETLQEFDIPYFVVSGNEEQRLTSAITIITQQLANQS